MQKIIFISAQNVYNPSSGVESRINNLVKILSKKSMLYIFGPKQELKNAPKNFFGFEYKNKFNKIYDPRIIKKSIELNKDGIDAVFATTLWSGLNGYLLSKKINKPFYFDDHNVEFLRFKRINSIIWPVIYLFERFLCRAAQKLICVSDVDRSFFIKYYKLDPDKIKIIENPVNNKIFYCNNSRNKKVRKDLGIKKNEKMILFFGQLDYAPNVEALKIIESKILKKIEQKHYNYRLIICGKGDGKGLLKHFKHKNIIFKGFVERIQDYINACDVVIAPLKSGSGTRIKILEALACKKKVISTSIGAEGIKKNKFLIIEDDWEKFVEKI